MLKAKIDWKLTVMFNQLYTVTSTFKYPRKHAINQKAKPKSDCRIQLFENQTITFNLVRKWSKKKNLESTSNIYRHLL